MNDPVARFRKMQPGLEAMAYKLLAQEPLVSEIVQGICSLCLDGAKDLSLDVVPSDEAVIWWCGTFGCSLDCHCETTYREYQDMAKTQVLSDGSFEIFWNGSKTFEVRLFGKAINAFEMTETVPASVTEAIVIANDWWQDKTEGDTIVQVGGKKTTQALVGQEFA